MQGRNRDTDIESRLWTQLGKERVGPTEKGALKHIRPEQSAGFAVVE